MSIRDRDTKRIVGHLVTWDVMGPDIDHPLSCSIEHRAIDCPHWKALDRLDVHLDESPVKGITYAAVLVADRLHLFRGAVGAYANVQAEIKSILDAFVAETKGNTAAIDDWLDRQWATRDDEVSSSAVEVTA